MKSIKWLLVLHVLPIHLFAQEQLKAWNQVELLVGKRGLESRKIENINPNLDFFDRLQANNPPVVYIGMALKKRIKERNFIALNASSDDDAELINWELIFGRQINRYLGLNFGTNIYNMMARQGYPLNFEKEFKDYNYDNLNNQSYAYIYYKNYSLFLEPSFRYRYKNLIFNASIKTGIGGLTKNPSNFRGQSTQSFEVIDVNSSTLPSMFFFYQPGAQIVFLPFKTKNSRMGFQIKTNVMPANRRYNYVRKINIWTDQNPITEKWKGALYHIQRTEIDIGLIWLK